MIELRFCTIKWIPYGARVTFPDGCYCDATPHPDDPHYRVISNRLGYGDDMMAYCREHEFCHAFVEQELHCRPSKVLRGVARNEMLSGPDAAYEEFMAQGFQRFLRANERPIVGGVDWDGLKRKALELLG